MTLDRDYDYTCPNGHPFPEHFDHYCSDPDCEAAVACVPTARLLGLIEERNRLRDQLHLLIRERARGRRA